MNFYLALGTLGGLALLYVFVYEVVLQRKQPKPPRNHAINEGFRGLREK